MEKYPDKDLGGSSQGDYLNLNWEWKSSLYYKKEISEMISHDILDLLPSDPFGMETSSSFTAITGRIEEVDKDIGFSSLGIGKDEAEVKKSGDDRLFSGLNLVWKGATRIYPEVVDIKSDMKSVGDDMDKKLLDGILDGSYLLGGNIDFSYGKHLIPSDEANKVQGCQEYHCDGDLGAPPDALFFALGYLGVMDLLSVERVCKSLRDAVQNDPLLWRSIHIDQPLSKRVTDDSLLHLTSRAGGSLQCLSLVNCFYITDDGMKSVLESNPGLTKLSVPGCRRLSVGGILSNLKAVKSAGVPGIKYLRIAGLLGVTEKDFEELNCMLAVDNHEQLSARKPQFYCGGQLYLSFDDDRAIDIEACPRCQQLRLVYDCPAEGCRANHHTCRGCTSCIARCIHCGCCLNGREYEETFCLDTLCLDCFKQLLNCGERQEGMNTHSKQSIFHQQASYHFRFTSSCG